MSRLPAGILTFVLLAAEWPSAGAESLFTPLEPLPRPKIVRSAEAYPGGGYNAENLLDGRFGGGPRSEYASAGKGLETFVDFDFGRPARIAAFQHVDRMDPATVASADLIFSDAADFAKPLAKVPVQHANTRGGVTCASFPPVTARYVRWQVTALGPQKYGTVGGAEIAFFTALEPEATPSRVKLAVRGLPSVVLQHGKPARSIEVTVDYPYAERVEASLELAGVTPIGLGLSLGTHKVETALPALDPERPVSAALKIAGRPVAESRQALKPVRPWVLYLLPHSHVDIGYTHVQTEVERLQWKHLEEAIDLAARTADYPPEARFKWNSEVLWAVDGYLKQATPEKRARFAEAVKKGWLHLDALYGNELTGLCRPEELFRLLDCARRLSRQFGVTIDAAMISDVPGYTWGIVPALAQSGVKYFSMGPNHIHRIGHTLEAWGDKPFYWVSPSGQEKVLCWMAGKGYSWFHPGLLDRIKNVPPQRFFEYLESLETSGYPYDMVQLRYSINGDNGPPDPDLPDFVKTWNAKYVHPKLVIATTREMFHEFERRYHDSKIPHVRGDFTPYWEDGAASSAAETAVARNTAERLATREALWAALDPSHYPADAFYAAWRNVLLYNEHTWGAYCSISQPDSELTKAQWTIKQAFALEAKGQSGKLEDAALAGYRKPAQTVAAVDVWNLTSWARTQLVILPPGGAVAGMAVKSAGGTPVPSQRLRSGALAFLAADVPALAARRFFFSAGEAPAGAGAKAEANTLGNQRLRLAVDGRTGAIASLRGEGLPVDLAGAGSGLGLNGYFYVAGRDPKGVQRDANVRIAVGEPGPLIASLDVDSDAPGCETLRRELALVNGQDHLLVTNVLVRRQVRTPESVHFGFGFHVPEGVMRMDIPWAVIRPELDQLPGACKNYFSVGRWVDVSNGDFGVTWTTNDAPLVEVGAITVDVASPFQSHAFLQTVPPTQTFYSYVMNNYWETNYKADQPGKTVFHYAVRPHGPFDAAAATRFAIEQSQPLLAVPVDENAPPARSEPLLRVEPASVIVSLLKPSDDGKARIVRLFNAASQPVKATMIVSDSARRAVAWSSPREEIGPPVTGPIELPGFGIVTLVLH